MLVLVLCILALFTPVLFGGHLSRLAYVHFRAWWILLAALLSQILIIEIFPDADRALLEAVHIATYVAAGVFVAINWRIPGLLIIAAGGACNGITIALNGGQLPASEAALKMAGIELESGEFVNSGVLSDPVLPLLGDIFAWPTPLPFANVFSVGDALIVLGVLYGANKVAGSRLVSKPWESPNAPVGREAGPTFDEEAADPEAKAERPGRRGRAPHLDPATEPPLAGNRNRAG